MRSTKERCCCATSSISTPPTATRSSTRPSRAPSSFSRPPSPRAKARTKRKKSKPRAKRKRRAAEGGDGEEGEESSVSLATMEAQLRPSVVGIFDAIADIHKKLNKLQDQRITAIAKRTTLPRATDRRYDKLKDEAIELLEKIRFNNTRIEHLVEQ